jgi:hypothetical protein
MVEQKTVSQVLDERNADYGDSWLTPNAALLALCGGDLSRISTLVETGHFANWFIILGKLARALNSPTKIDHWVDIAGYAQLSVESLSGKPRI